MAEATARELRYWCRFSVFWYPTVVGGWALLFLAVWRSASVICDASDVAALVMCAALLVALELLPLVHGQGHDPQGVVMSTAFVCAVLFYWGPWPAIVMVCLAAIASDLRARKASWKLAFNVGQYSLTVFAGYLVLWLAGERPSLDHPLGELHPVDLSWMAGAWIVYYGVNLILVVGVISHGRSFRTSLLEDIGHYTAMTFAVLAISPVIVVMADTVWWLLPVLLVPLLLLYWIAQLSLNREHEASHDPLTGLPNRSSMDYALTTGLAEHRRLALLLIDLDHFKEVNDTLGHHAGDQLLIGFAGRLRHAIRSNDHPARLGGDEFAVMLPDAGHDEALSVAERIRDSLTTPFSIDGLSVDVETSIGIAVFPDHAGTAEDLFRRADIAMYDAKASRTTIATYSARRDDTSAGRLSVLSDLRRALHQDELQLHYQPKVSVADGAVLGVEALVRWQHPTRGLVPPDEFIPLAERSGLMPLLTETVLGLALTQAAQWWNSGLEVPVAVNVSLPDILDSRLHGFIDEALSSRGLPASALLLEITERVMTEQTPDLNDAMASLQELGVTFSLDDFGTGYSSLVRLQALPVNELKIDRAFTNRLHTGTAALGIVRSIIELAHALGIPAIAEGVETETEWQLLSRLDCDGAQGWHIARAMPALQATEWLHHNLATTPSIRSAVRRQLSA